VIQPALGGLLEYKASLSKIVKVGFGEIPASNDVNTQSRELFDASGGKVFVPSF
jgi:hypothetical protein